MLGRLWRAVAGRDDASDFLSAEIARPECAAVVVSLDGMALPYAVAADVEAGWVDVWRTDRFGRPMNVMGWPVKDRHYGRVAIRFRSEADRLQYEGDE